MTTSKPTNVTCPECGGSMTPRMSQHGKFWGCSDYPRCRGTRDSMGQSKEDREANRSYQDGDESDYTPRWDR
jgi:ssDNA-binding Zn-finger/Zn-ribbon topoisomerase 1